jgi:putative FmdB family regulatory protein
MPIYEYGCSECGHQFEEQQKLSDPPLVTCPTCGKDKLEKIISPTAFVLKGGGWYKDGYGAPGSKRTENQRIDRLQKSIDDDKKKTAAASSESSTSTGSEKKASSS